MIHKLAILSDALTVIFLALWQIFNGGTVYVDDIYFIF